MKKNKNAISFRVRNTTDELIEFEEVDAGLWVLPKTKVIEFPSKEPIEIDLKMFMALLLSDGFMTLVRNGKLQLFCWKPEGMPLVHLIQTGEIKELSVWFEEARKDSERTNKEREEKEAAERKRLQAHGKGGSR